MEKKNYLPPSVVKKTPPFSEVGKNKTGMKFQPWGTRKFFFDGRQKNARLWRLGLHYQTSNFEPRIFQRKKMFCLWEHLVMLFCTYFSLVFWMKPTLFQQVTFLQIFCFCFSRWCEFLFAHLGLRWQGAFISIIISYFRQQEERYFSIILYFYTLGCEMFCLFEV